MSPILIVVVVVLYFGLLLLISHLSAKGGDNFSFFSGSKSSPWYLVAFGMIGTSLSGVTFISVPGWVGGSQFSYMQMVLGYLLGYIVVAKVLLPLYYRLNLTSIYEYLEQRFGYWSYKTGAFYFLLSRTIGAAFRLYLVANVLQLSVFNHWGVPFFVTVAITILLIWVYTFKGGIKTIVWTDSLQTLFMLVAVGVAVYSIGSKLNLSFSEMYDTIKASNYSRVFFFEDWRSGNFFWKQFLSGAFITIVMTGLDQDMMQKNLSCKNLKEAQWNMGAFSVVLVVVNLLFLCLGALLFLYVDSVQGVLPIKSDDLFPQIALSGEIGVFASLFFILGLVAAAYSSADSALTALTTSFCIDIIEISKKPKSQQVKIRKKVHIMMSAILFVVIILFSLVSNDNVITSLFKLAGYTYGPLLGLFAFGMFTKQQLKDKLVPLVCLSAPVFTFLINNYSEQLLWGYSFGFEIIILNGLITFLGLIAIKRAAL